MPPTEPGACSQIAVDREEELAIAMEHLDRETSYVFIEGELGFGKSFFLQWLRDELAPASAVSIIDLDDETTFLDQGTLVSAIRSGLQTPRTLETDQFANGVDELWATFLHTIETQSLDHLESRGFETTEDRVKPNILSVLRTIVDNLAIPQSLSEQLVDIGEANLTGSRSRSFSKEFPDTEITDENAQDVLHLFAGSLDSAAID
ncbi:BREX system ATP-binding domain-containing protein [Saliphagus sp. GCM10025308]